MPETSLKEMALISRLGDEAQIAETIDSSLAQQTSTIGALLEKQLVAEHDFLQAVCAQYKLPWWDASLPPMDEKLRQQFPARLALRYHLFPVRLDENNLYLLTYDPFNLTARQVITQEIREPVTWCVATRQAILAGLRTGYGVGAETFDAILEGRDVDDATLDLKQEVNVLDEEDPEATVVSFVNQIMRAALDERATDIHVEPLENDLRIRYRIDGVLHEVPVPSKIKMLQASVISRIKIMANLDIAERRMPQDGRIELSVRWKAMPIDRSRQRRCPPCLVKASVMRVLDRGNRSTSIFG